MNVAVVLPIRPTVDQPKPTVIPTHTTNLRQRIRFTGELDGLPTTARHVLIILLTFADPDGFAFPSRKTIARECGFGATTARPRTATVTTAMHHLRTYMLDGLPLIEDAPQKRRANRVRLHHQFRYNAPPASEAAVRDAHQPEYAMRTTPRALSVLPSDQCQREDHHPEENLAVGDDSGHLIPGHLRITDVRNYPKFNDDADTFSYEVVDCHDIMDGARERVVEWFHEQAKKAGGVRSRNWFTTNSKYGISMIGRASDYFKSGERT